MKILGFTVRDLEMSRAGLISKQQKWWLRKALALEVKRYTIFYGIAWIASLIFGLGLYNSPLRQSQYHIIVNAGVVISIVGLIVVSISYVALLLQVRSDLMQGRVNFVDGKIEFSWVDSVRPPVEVIRVSKMKFTNMGIDVFLSLQKHCRQDSLYRLYYTLHRRKIMAVELIE